MQKDKLITLKLVDFDTLERDNLHAVLTLAERGLQNKWQLVESETADFYLLSIKAIAELETNEALKVLPERRCLYCATHKEVNQAHVLVVGEQSMCSLRALVVLFNQVAQEDLLKIESNPPKRVPETQIKPLLTEQKDEFFDTSKDFLGSLLENTEFFLKITLHSQPEFPALYINIQTNSYYSQKPLLLLESYLMATTDELMIIPLIKKELEAAIVTEELKVQKIKDLVWFSVIKNSAGRVIKGHSEDDVVNLQVWPDLRLPSCLKYAKIATFMKNNTATLHVIAEKTGFSLADVNTFYNACYMTGLIGYEIIPELKTKKRDSKTLGLFSKISARLHQ